VTPSPNLTFRERLLSREPLLCSFGIELPAAAVPEAMAQAGFDALIVDLEHSPFTLSEAATMVVACRAAGLASVIRVGDSSRSAITKAADLWPDGLMFPGVATAEEARAIVAAARYHPHGSRGVCPMVRYAPLPRETRFATLNESLALVVQVEGAEGVANAPAIAAIPGVDALFVGTYDLSQALGITGEIEDERILSAGRDLRARLPDTTPIGAYVQSAETARAWADAGASLIAYGTDAQLFLSACQVAVAFFHGDFAR
jgi:4-hydroxy-2-oxoheptanedioate aldolase